jgi:hypothetical protein
MGFCQANQLTTVRIKIAPPPPPLRANRLMSLWTVYASPPLIVPVVTWHLKLVRTIPFTQDSKENGKAHSRDKPIDPAGGQLGL